jgi:hypothetical protein
MAELLGTAAAKSAITEVIYRYCRAVDRMDRDLMVTVFHPGATADYGTTFEGTAEGLIENFWINHPKLAGHSHQVTNILIEVDADRASSESYAFGTLWDTADDGTLVVLTAYGRYLDQWSCKGGTWAIDHRRFIYDLTYVNSPGVNSEAAGSRLARLASSRDASQSAARRDRTDPSYEIMNRA